MEQFDFGRMLLLAIVLDVAELQDLKKAFARLLKSKNEYLRVYVAHPDNISVPRSPGESLAMVAGYKGNHGSSVAHLLRHTASVLDGFLEECDRHLLVITDCLAPRTAGQLSMLGSMVSHRFSPAKATVLFLGETGAEAPRLPESVQFRGLARAEDLINFVEVM